MAIRLCVNTAYRECAEFRIGDGTGAATSDQAGKLSITGGPRHLFWTANSTGTRTICYANKNAGMSFDTFIFTRADRHVGHGYYLMKYTTFIGATAYYESTANWNPTLVGPNSQDYITTAYSDSGVEALALQMADGTAGNYTRSFSQVYFSTSLTFSYPGPVIIRPRFDALRLGRQNFLIDREYRFSFDIVSRSDVQTLERLWKVNQDACFLYDSAGTLIADKLIQVVIPQISVTPVTDDANKVEFTAYRLRYYS